jgi:hypothetical protein
LWSHDPIFRQPVLLPHSMPPLSPGLGRKPNHYSVEKGQPANEEKLCRPVPNTPCKKITAPHLINLGRGIAEPDRST